MENWLTREFLVSHGTVSSLRQLEKNGTYELGAPLLSRPVFLTAEEHATLARDTSALFALIRELPDRLFGGDRARHAAAVGFSSREYEAVSDSADLPCTEMGRADFFRDDRGFRLLEYNVGHNVGGWNTGYLAEWALRDPGLGAFATTHGLTYDDPRLAVRGALVRAAGTFAPMVAVLGSPGPMRPGEPIFPDVVAWLEDLGVEAVGGHLGQIEEQDDGIYVNRRKIDLVYRMWGVRDIRDDPVTSAAHQLLLEHARQRTVALHTPLTPEPASSKANLALVSDPANHSMLEDDQRSLVARTIPWTRMVCEGRTEKDGESVDLLDHLMAHQRDLVLKPVLSFGGAGVVAGWDVPPERWRKAVETALVEAHIVQERVRPVAERFADWDDPTASEDIALNWGALCIDGGYSGCMIRGMAEARGPVISQSRGAGLSCVLREDATLDGPDRHQ